MATLLGVRHIQNGEPVEAGVANRPASDLAERDEYLLGLINALHLGETLYLRERAVTEDCRDGWAVYYDPDRQAFAPALASAPAPGELEPDRRSLVVGVVERKLTATVADVATAGALRLDPAGVEAPDRSGPRYLSAQQPGRLTAYRPAFAVLVGQWLAEYRTLVVQPRARDALDGHTHHCFKLYAEPAGQPNQPVYMDRHSILSADPTKPGWLPADHPVFGGLAPSGAKFGYNIARHPELFRVFPPVPLDSAYLEVYLDGAGRGRELNRVAAVTTSGIWWFRDDWGWAPWQLDLQGLNTNPDLVQTPPERPAPVELQHGHGYVDELGSHQCSFALYLWFSRPTHHNDNAVVTSLTVEDGAPLTLKDCAGQPAATGNLRLGFNLGLLAGQDDHPGGLAVKEFDGKTVKRGPVVAGLRSLSPSLSVVALDGQAPDPDGFLPGRVTLAFRDSAVARDLEVSLFALDGATEEKYAGMFYLGFRPGRRSSARARLDVPSLGLPAGPLKVEVSLRVVCTQSGALPILRCSYRRLAGSAALAPLPGDGAEIVLPDLDLSRLGSAAGGNLYADVKLGAPLEARAGETLFFTLERSTDSYLGIVGVLRARGEVTDG